MRDGGIIHPPTVEVVLVVLDALLTRPPTTATATTIRATVVKML
jgi:hypothetical protein